MGLFNDLMSKIFDHASSTGAPTTQTQSTPGAPQQAQAPAAPAATVAAPPAVDVSAILNDLAKKKSRETGLEKVNRGFDEAGWDG